MKTALLSLWMLVLCVGAVVAQEEGPPAQAAFRAAAARAKGLPLADAVPLYEAVVAGFPGTEFAGQALLDISTLYLVDKQYEKANEYADLTLAAYGGWYLAGSAVRRKCVVSLYCLKQPREVLDYLTTALPTYQTVMLPEDLAWMPCYRYDAWVQLGDKEQALAALRDAVVETPQVLDQAPFISRYVPALLAAGEKEQALAAVRGAFACCGLRAEEIKQINELAVRTLLTSGDPTAASDFLASQKDPTKENPLAKLPWPTLTVEDKAKMLTNCRNKPHSRIVAMLYWGDFNQAFMEASVNLAQAKDERSKAVCADDVARCLKAKDLNLTRAQAFIEFAKQGTGENPAANF